MPRPVDMRATGMQSAGMPPAAAATHATSPVPTTPSGLAGPSSWHGRGRSFRWSALAVAATSDSSHSLPSRGRSGRSSRIWANRSSLRPSLPLAARPRHRRARERKLRGPIRPTLYGSPIGSSVSGSMPRSRQLRQRSRIAATSASGLRERSPTMPARNFVPPAYSLRATRCGSGTVRPSVAVLHQAGSTMLCSLCSAVADARVAGQEFLEGVRRDLEGFT